MSVYKEGWRAKEIIEQRSRRIYPDACDYGVPVNKEDQNWNYVSQLVEWYGDKNTRKLTEYSTGKTVTQEVTLIDEWTEDEHERIIGKHYRFLVTYVTVRQGVKIDGKKFYGYVYITKMS